MPRLAVKSALLRWASDRAGLPWETLSQRFPRLSDWESGALQPTLTQLKSFASATHVPVGTLLLPKPPAEPLPLPDFRSRASARVRRPSGDLLDTIYICQIRHEWFRDYALREGIGRARTSERVAGTAAAASEKMRDLLRVPSVLPSQPYNALRLLTGLAERAGVLVMASGVVGNNTRRRLAVDEFRGFVIADDFAPLVFINAADSMRAQLFTLVHEMAHLLRGQSAVSEAEPGSRATESDEYWCNQVAGDLLVPTGALAEEIKAHGASADLAARLRARFPVSAAVAFIRAHSAGLIPRSRVDAEIKASGVPSVPRLRAAGGNFYNTQGRRVGAKFATAVVRSTQEGRTPILEALELLGLRNAKSFDRLAGHLGLE